ncbi:transposase [Nitrobacter vulgaris]|nr:transposase [Nitrobacter vulgaris]
MRQKSGARKAPAKQVIRTSAVRRANSTRLKEGLHAEASMAALYRREGIAESLYYNWSKEFLEAAKKRLAGDRARTATGDEVKVRA